MAKAIKGVLTLKCKAEENSYCLWKQRLTNESAKPIVVIFHLALRWVLQAFQVIHFLHFSLTGKLIWPNSTSSKRENPIFPLPLLPFSSSPAFGSIILSFSFKLAGWHSWAPESAHQTIRNLTSRSESLPSEAGKASKRLGYITARDLLSFFTLLFIFLYV